MWLLLNIFLEIGAGVQILVQVSEYCPRCTGISWMSGSPEARLFHLLTPLAKSGHVCMDLFKHASVNIYFYIYVNTSWNICVRIFKVWTHMVQWTVDEHIIVLTNVLSFLHLATICSILPHFTSIAPEVLFVWNFKMYIYVLWMYIWINLKLLQVFFILPAIFVPYSIYISSSWSICFRSLWFHTPIHLGILHMYTNNLAIIPSTLNLTAISVFYYILSIMPESFVLES